MRRRLKIEKGFTLIELLVVISIIGVLAALVIANFNAARERARDVQRKSDLAQLKRALRMYYNDYNGYPDTATLPAWGAAFSSGDMVYMKRLPEEPTPGGVNYAYYAGSAACSDGVNDFRLVAVLENTADPEIAKSHTRCPDDCGYTTDESSEYVVCAD